MKLIQEFVKTRYSKLSRQVREASKATVSFKEDVEPVKDSK